MHGPPRGLPFVSVCRHSDGGCLGVPVALYLVRLIPALSALSQLASRLTPRALQDLDVVARLEET